MPPVRTMSTVKPVKTERTHEENQERAYIAASRRSDRSLEARVESARRASEIHKRRTGRSLRVTEEDVVNEEMYEEEDDDLPMQYRRLTAHLQTQNAHFDRRLSAYITQQMAIRSAVSTAYANSQGANNPSNQFMNPAMMQQMQNTGYMNPMMQPQVFNMAPPTYRQSPYPMPNTNMNGIRANFQHGRSASIATPQELAAYQQQQQQHQQSQSVQTSPIDTVKPEDRRMSLPAQNMLPQTPQSQDVKQETASPSRTSPFASRHGSSTNLANPSGYLKQSQSPQQVPTPPQQAQPQQQRQRQEALTSPFGAEFNQAMENGMGPLTTALPIESQQLLAGSHAFSMNDTMPAMHMQGHGMRAPQPFYSYNPNGKPKGSNSSNGSQTNFDPLNQTLTLAPAALDTALGGFDNNYLTTPHSDASDALYTPQGFNYSMGFDSFDNFGIDPLKMSQSGGNSTGNVTPQDEWNFSSFINDFPSGFEDQSAAA